MQKSPYQLHKKSPVPNPSVLRDFEVRETNGDDKIKEGSLHFTSEDEALEYLAKVLVEAYFKQKKYERTK